MNLYSEHTIPWHPSYSTGILRTRFSLYRDAVSLTQRPARSTTGRSVRVQMAEVSISTHGCYTAHSDLLKWCRYTFTLNAQVWVRYPLGPITYFERSPTIVNCICKKLTNRSDSSSSGPATRMISLMTSSGRLARVTGGTSTTSVSSSIWGGIFIMHVTFNECAIKPPVACNWHANKNNGGCFDDDCRFVVARERGRIRER